MEVTPIFKGLQWASSEDYTSLKLLSLMLLWSLRHRQLIVRIVNAVTVLWMISGVTVGCGRPFGLVMTLAMLLRPLPKPGKVTGLFKFTAMVFYFQLLHMRVSFCRMKKYVGSLSL